MATMFEYYNIAYYAMAPRYRQQLLCLFRFCGLFTSAINDAQIKVVQFFCPHAVITQTMSIKLLCAIQQYLRHAREYLKFCILFSTLTPMSLSTFSAYVYTIGLSTCIYTVSQKALLEIVKS